ncbi:MAG: molybdate ABC transporter substrate-binding protein [Planctomycetota bacterium]
MKRLLLVCLATALLQFACGCESGDDRKELTVFAAASLTDAMTEIGAAFEAKTGAGILLNFQASTTLEQQIRRGAPADVFISASPRQVDSLAKDGLIDADSRIDLLRNSVVVVVHIDANISVGKPEDIVSEDVTRIAIADPELAPAGQYARESLTHYGLWDRAVAKGVTNSLDVRAALAAVEGGDAEVGIVYRTDAAISKKVKIVCELPPESHKPIIYPAVILKDCKDKELAKEFMEFLRTDEVKEIFKKHGFTPVVN